MLFGTAIVNHMCVRTPGPGVIEEVSVALERSGERRRCRRAVIARGAVLNVVVVRASSRAVAVESRQLCAEAVCEKSAKTIAKRIAAGLNM